MIEKLHESQLSGKDRLKHNTQKLAKLGMKVKTKEKMPANRWFMVERNRKERARKSIEDAKNRGILNASMKRELEVLHTGKASESGRPKNRDRGLKIGSGRFKDGVLHISQSHIDKINGGTAARVAKKNTHGRKKR
ncbi:hypothetical protein FBU59_001643 [Linderina macrospora]|uniref:Uncharacterized protein n=1 Tax=Linderina macrospora TaxID=4868 RepID=A0ACC1JDK1_9FUNG|nr:hypothetical protein FBU59_001643 [Linderina macrospora]